MKNWVFVTGAPGSFWSGVSQVIRDNWDVDNSDCTEEKTYTHPFPVPKTKNLCSIPLIL